MLAWINRVQQSNKMSVYFDEQPQMWQCEQLWRISLWWDFMDSHWKHPYVYDNLCMTYILLVWGWKVNGLRSSTQRICKCTGLWAVKQTDGGKPSKTNRDLQPLKTKWQDSAHPLGAFIWPAVSSRDDQHSKLTRDGNWAPSQQDTPVSWFTPLF